MTLLEFIGGLAVLAATLALFWAARPRGGEPPPFMHRRGMQTLVPGAVLYGLCASGTLIVKAAFSALG
ncbi:MAG TPA: hypothetical protein VNR11_03480 [Xanthobacteraceae bacterium]|nr:hypothetical protein [Xanthobacteraceae bacterium]